MQSAIEEIANRISEHSKSWMRQYELSAPDEIARRIKNARGTKDIVRTALGLFIKPQLDQIESIFIFEGLRNKDYMTVFRPESVIVIGSHLEKKYAKAHGYGFCWSFPVVSAIHSKMYRGWNFAINQQIKSWIKELSKFKKITFFLYEDTQPLGIFLVHLGKILKPKAVSICIQHGYLYIPKFEIRFDGRLCDVNFVWDTKQADLINSDRSSTFVIGLPYDAHAMSIDIPIVILVGTGMPYDGNGEYEKSLISFTKIYDVLSKRLGIKVFYRPHPNEWIHESLINQLQNDFLLLDDFEKVKRLNGPRAIFIGTISSLLYEASVAGHKVVHINLFEKASPVFDFDFEFNPENINDLVEWVSNEMSQNPPENTYSNLVNHNFLERFILALQSINSINYNVKKP